MRGTWTIDHGSGSSPTGQSISVGPPLAMPREIAAPSSSGDFTRTASRPKLSPSLTKSGLRKSLAMVRLLKACCWMRLTLAEESVDAVQFQHRHDGLRRGEALRHQSTRAPEALMIGAKRASSESR